MFKNFALAAMALLLFSCRKDVIRGSGNTIEQTKTVAAFDAVEAHYDIKAVISYGNTQSVRVRGYENLLGILETEVENGVLKLKYNHQYNTIRNSNVVAYIQLPALKKATTHGSGDINISGFQQGQELEVRIHGSADITVANSSYQKALLNIYGSGDIDAQTLWAKEAEVNVHGSGYSYITVGDKLKASIYGSGNIYYWGSPVTEVNINGSGRVMKR
jgi:Putative auto-transporter adhesin, head GIN domain